MTISQLYTLIEKIVGNMSEYQQVRKIQFDWRTIRLRAIQKNKNQ